ncbi:MAG: DsbA family protein [Vicingaceae bacterium]
MKDVENHPSYANYGQFWKVKLLILLSTLISSMSALSQEKPVLIYVGDPMCSWCYGFAPEIAKVTDELKDECDVQLVMGGLRPYNTETMADLGAFLGEHWDEVAKRSSVEFNHKILSDQSFVYDTEPPARAVVVIRSMDAELEFEFFKSIQLAFYRDNKNTNDVNTYLDILPVGIDKEAFKGLFESPAMKEAVKADYALASSLGVRGFPATLLKVNGQLYQTSNGYATADELINRIEAILKKSPSEVK